jgi:hypothetical protein
VNKRAAETSRAAASMQRKTSRAAASMQRKNVACRGKRAAETSRAAASMQRENIACRGKRAAENIACSGKHAAETTSRAAASVQRKHRVQRQACSGMAVLRIPRAVREQVAGQRGCHGGERWGEGHASQVAWGGEGDTRRRKSVRGGGMRG